MMKYIYVGFAVAIAIMAGTIYFLHKENQVISGKAKVLESVNESQKNKINQFARRPRTDDDVVQRLCAWASSIDGGKDSTQRVLPRGPCK